MIEVENLEKSFLSEGTELSIFSGVNFQLNAGESLALMGPSGCGKSTLISCLAGLMAPNKGAIKLQSQNILEMSDQQLAEFRSKKIGLVFQQFHLLEHLTAIENVMLPLDLLGVGTKQSFALAQKALADLQLEERSSHFPHQLSRGECQRVAIARALIHRPELILADEPTASLDRRSAERVRDLLIDLCRSNSAILIIATHDEEVAKKCSRRARFHLEHLEFS